MITFDVQSNLDGLQDNVVRVADQYQCRAAMELQSELIETTPRDTSRARSGWFIGAQHGAAVPPKGQTSYTPQRQQAPRIPAAMALLKGWVISGNTIRMVR